MIAFSDFTKSYSKKNTNAVGPVSFTVGDASISALVGENGAGKTTILKAACALHYATGGCVSVAGSGGAAYDAATDSGIVKSLVGFVPERYSLPKDAKPAELLDEKASAFGLSGREKEAAVLRAAERCSLFGVLFRKNKTLSKGFLQRLSFALALVNDPPNLVLDEATSALDPAEAAEIRSLIKTLGKTKAVLLSTHALHEAGDLCDEIIILHRGKIAARGTERAIAEAAGEATLEKAYLRFTQRDEGDT